MRLGIITPRRACTARGKVIALGLYILWSTIFFFFFFFLLSKYSLSGLLFEFNRLQYTLAALEVFMAFANPVSLASGYRVSIIRNTNIDRSKPHPYGIVVYTVEHAYTLYS